MPQDNNGSLSDKWAFVTGSSGGIGAAIAKELALAGANLVLHGHVHMGKAEDLARELRAIPISTHVASADLADIKNLPILAEAVWAHAPIDILVNTAGVDVLTGPAAQWSFEEKLAALWQVDVQATVTLSRALGNKMKERGTGAIVNIGWSQANTGMAGDSGQYFGAVKGAVASFSKSLAKSLAPQVRVNCVAPGWIQTKWGKTAPDYWRHRVQKESLVGRWGHPEDVARLVRFLVSPEAGYINGQVVDVDGGFAGAADQSEWN